MAKVSIIVTHWAMSPDRSTLMHISLDSLFETTAGKDVEIIVVDNGGSDEDSEWLVKQNIQGNIACYIRNRVNMHFWFVRNQALKICSGDYIVIADNDIAYYDGWLDSCLGFLERNSGKYLATPIRTDIMNRKPSRWRGEVDGWQLNERAGSNVFMFSRKSFEEIGLFDSHRIAGSKYVNTYLSKGYLMAVDPIPKAIDLGFRRGYNLNEDIKQFSL